MVERVEITGEQLDKIKAFNRCVRASCEGRRIFSMGNQEVTLFNSKGDVLVPRADRQIIGMIEAGANALYQELTHKDGKVDKFMKGELNSLVEAAQFDSKKRSIDNIWK